jgi:hypothetical protein
MTPLRRFIILMLFVGWTLSGATGCSMFQKKQERPKKEGPQTVQEWIGLDRVKPTK